MLLQHNKDVKFNKGDTYENFVGQFQKYCPKLLCIINGNTLHYYDKTAEMPINLIFERKQQHKDVIEYYFKDNNNTYCVFGEEAAKIFYPNIRLEQVLKQIDDAKKLPLFHEKFPKSSVKNIRIHHGGVKIDFSEYNYPIQIVIFNEENQTKL